VQGKGTKGSGYTVTLDLKKPGDGAGEDDR
jgi:hypothetical protein